MAKPPKVTGPGTYRLEAGARFRLFSERYSPGGRRYRFTAIGADGGEAEGSVEVVLGSALLSKTERYVLKPSNAIRAPASQWPLGIYVLARNEMLVTPEKQRLSIGNVVGIIAFLGLLFLAFRFLD